MNESNRNLLIRIASALVLAPPLVLSVIWHRPEALGLWALAAVLIGLGEFYWITLSDDPVWLRLVGVAIGGGLAVFTYYAPIPDATLVYLIGATLLISILQLFWHREIPLATTHAAMMGFGLLYIPILLTPLALLKRLPLGGEWIILACCITWFSDTGAYAVGRAIGKRKLYPAISPKKSIEGAMGGVFFAVVAAVMAKLWFLPVISWLDVALLGIIGSLLGMVGDLVESMIKRAYGVKDSGRAIPGHGGLLDRIDGLLFVVPFVYVYARYLVP